MWASVSQAVFICLELWNRTQSAECTCMFKIKTLVESHETTSLFQKLYWLTTNLILKHSWVITCSNTCVLLKKFWNCHIQLYYSILCQIPHFMKRGSNTSDLFPHRNWDLLWIWHFDDADIETQRSHSWTEEWERLIVAEVHARNEDLDYPGDTTDRNKG